MTEAERLEVKKAMAWDLDGLVDVACADCESMTRDEIKNMLRSYIAGLQANQ